MLEINNTTRHKINQKKTRALVEKFLRSYKKPGLEVSLAIVSDATIKRLNKEYRGVNQTTDVLSFGPPRLERAGRSGKEKKRYLGEIVINIQEAKRGSKYRALLAELGLDRSAQLSADYIFYFLLIHGLLHLSGFNDRTAKGRREMLQAGKNFLKVL